MSYSIDNILEAKSTNEILDLLYDNSHLKFEYQFFMKDIGISSRVYNHWVKKGLITGISKVGEYKFEFNFFDLLWFNIIIELRGYGFPLDKIKNVKKHLMEEFMLIDTIEHFDVSPEKKKILNYKDILGEEYQREIESVKEHENEFLNPENNPNQLHEDIYTTSLQLIFSRFMFDRADIRLLIDMEGTVFPCTKRTIMNNQLSERMMEGGFDSESYISISLFKFLKSFILKKENQEFVRNNNFLNENELYILSLIREGKAHAITIRFEGQKPTHIEITSKKKIYAESRISEILLKHGYQDITIKTQDGNIAFSNVTIKKRLK